MATGIAEYVDQVNQAALFLNGFISSTPQVAIQLGTGLGGLVGKVDAEHTLDYSDIPFFPRSTVSSHHGKLIIGLLNDAPVIILSGRFHYYEGYSTKEVTFPIRVLRALGVQTVIITNAAGGLNPLFLPGTIMVIRDHLNFLGENPLRGPNVDEWGPRFPDLSEPYAPELVKAALDSADSRSIKKVVTGIYACIAGPSLETPAETRWLRGAGGDAVGMSSVPEVIVAIHGGMKVLGLSVVANVNNPDDMQPIILEDIIQTASAVEPQLEQLIVEIISRITPA
jgi:purine-nucleoside phosphorylase